MILFPNCKINVGLDILRRRDDGYHDIDTLMVPVPELYDVLEIIKTDELGIKFTTSGLATDCEPQANLCVKAYDFLNESYDIGGVYIHLHKVIPFGAGLGGGSSDAAFTLKGLNAVFELGLGEAGLEELGARMGSDVPFFIRNKPQIARGRGEILSPFDLNIGSFVLLIIKPDAGVSTAGAYAGVNPYTPELSLEERLKADIFLWKETIHNRFEESVFSSYPELAKIKHKLYDLDAAYASMSGSGSAIYGIFPVKDHTESFLSGLSAVVKNAFPGAFVFQQVM